MALVPNDVNTIMILVLGVSVTATEILQKRPVYSVSTLGFGVRSAAGGMSNFDRWLSAGH